MKITENTDHRLVIEHRPWLWAGVLWVLGGLTLYFGATGDPSEGDVARVVTIAMGTAMLFAAWYWFAFLRITFDRDTNRVEHRSIRPFGSRSKSLALDRVRAARVEARWDDAVRMTRLALDTEDGRAQLEYGYTSADRRALEDAVNEWLSRPPARPISRT